MKSASRSRTVVRGLVVMMALAPAAGCHHRGRAQALAPCEPATAQPAAEMNLDLLNGRFDVQFVADQGPRSGQMVRGTLVLRPQDAGLVSVEHADTNTIVSQPTIGQLELAFEEVGATRMGDSMAESSAMPGVGLYVTHLRDGRVTGVVARVGSQSNTRGVSSIDGGYFALYIRRVDAGGIRGGWASSLGTGAGLIQSEARGYFCATRVAR